MSRSEIVLFPAPVLRAKAERVTAFDAGLARLAQKMESVMKGQRHGIGIAAPQLGISKRLALVDVSSRVPGSKLLVLVNPEITERGPDRVSREGCMSLPDYTADLRRWEWVTIRWQDLSGAWNEQRFDGIESICVQHEIDHLNGILFLDRVICLKTDMYSRARKKSI